MPNIFETTDAAAGSSTTYALGQGQTARGQLATGADHDWYAVSLTAGQTYTFAMTGTGTNNVADTYLRLYGIGGVTLAAENDDGLEGNNSVITFTPGTSGTYYLDAGSFNNASAGQYGLSFTSGSRSSFDTDMGAGVMDSDLSWSATPGAGATVTYGFRQSPASYTVTGSNIATFSQLTAAQIAAVQSILQVFSELTGVTFTQVNPGGTTDNATILFANYNDATDGAGAFAFFPGSTASTAQAGDVWLNTQSVSTADLPFGSYSYFAIMHEIGHALGLSHPGLYNAAPGVSITYANDAQFVQDTHQYSMMSYFDEANTGAGNYNSYADAPMLHDILSLQSIYGANAATRSGATVYGFGSTAGALYDFAINASPALSIWDGGGADTLNASGFAQDQLINLAETSFSNIGGITANISIAVGAVIENAIGGSGNDTIYGNAVANTLYGGAGIDRIDGGADNDIWLGGDAGLDYITGNLGNDRIDGGADNDTWLGGDAGLDYITGGAGNDRIDGGADNDTWLGGDAELDYITGGLGNDRIDGGADNDTWLGGDAGLDYITGGLGNDRIDGGADNDTWLGGDAGLDYITGGLGNDRIDGGADNDTWLGGDAGLDTITGGTGNDRIDGGSETDTLFGDDGNDYITAGAGDDVIEGGASTDSLFGDAGLDLFDFNTGSGSDSVYDFANDQDTLRIDPGYGFANAAAVVAATTVFGTDARINLPGGFSIYLVGYLAANSIASLGDDIVIG